MNKKEYLEILEEVLDDDNVAVTLVVDDESISFIGNMNMNLFEDIVLQLAESIAESIASKETIH